MPASPPQMPALGFVGLGQYLDANRGALSDQFDATKKKSGDTLSGGDQGAEGDLGRSLGSENALAGMYGAPGNGGAPFDAALSWSAYGPQYKTLSDTLNTAANTVTPPPPPVSQIDPNGQQRDRPTQPQTTPAPSQAAGAAEGDGGASFTPSPSGDQGAGISGLRKALRQVGR